ncbi:hypothetical protein LTSEALA_0820 [Salmonella enterica subsp. enterica serovar Alachua str. R6-377]|uniref:Uncharacterized protein n=1 Tax=Salmonella enterica subsp. enterica serovar Alachua str. R6-377 TaxID=913241 RepID=G5LKC1_SALET|nr:hypothetical protein LTSEALA_0820 [Salmonella enterica subsp. enterica serovar Alachua str. R6-377]
MQRGINGAAADITSQPRLTGDVLLQAGFCRRHNRLRFRPRIKKNGSLHPVRYDLRTTNRQTVSHRAYTLTVQGFLNHIQQIFYCCTITLPAQYGKYHLCRSRTGCAGICHTSVRTSGVKFIGSRRSSNGQSLKCCRDALAQRLIIFHHCGDRRYCIIISRHYRQTFHVAVGCQLLKIISHRIGHHHRLRSLVNTLAQQDFAVCAFLQQLGDGFRFQRQRAPYRVLFIHRIKSHKSGLALSQQRLKIRHVHYLRRR